MNPETYRAGDLSIDRSHLSPNALYVVQQLQLAGFDGYLVGGCVRDLLLGRIPKDFDVTTDASPEEIADIFERSRIIGRRFKLVHVRFGRGRDSEIVEVATYRAAPAKNQSHSIGVRPSRSQKGRILDDNVFGTIDADAIRRDFSINALYYDPVSEQILDFVGGMKDIENRTLKMIGNPEQRYKEDPVRMLRVIRFKAKLELTVDKSTNSAIRNCVHLIDDVPGARLFDETFKMFHHAAAVSTWDELRLTPLPNRLFSQTMEFLKGEQGGKFNAFIHSALENTDNRVRAGLPVIPGYFFAVILWWPFKRAVERLGDKKLNRVEKHQNAVDQVFRRQSGAVTIPLRVKHTVSEIWEFQELLVSRRPKSINRILEHRRFRAAYDFLSLRMQISEVSSQLVDWWTEIQDCSAAQRSKMIQSLPQPSGRKSGRKRRSRKRNTGNSSKSAR